MLLDLSRLFFEVLTKVYQESLTLGGGVGEGGGGGRGEFTVSPTPRINLNHD